MSILDQYAVIGVTVFLSTCTFRVEVGHRGLDEAMTDIDTYLTSTGVAENTMERVAAVIANADELGRLLSKNTVEIDAERDDEEPENEGADKPLVSLRDEGAVYTLNEQSYDQDTLISEISYAFLYAYLKQKGDLDLSRKRGVVGAFVGEVLYFKSAETDPEYDEATRMMADALSRASGHRYAANFLDASPPSPTIH